MTRQMNGHPVRVIDRDLLLALNRLRTAGEIKVTIVLIDNTIGWQRHSAEISISTFMRDARLSRQGVFDALSKAKDDNVYRLLNTGNSYKHSSEYYLNDHQDWSIKLTSQESRPVDQSDGKSRPVESQNLTSTGLLPTPTAEGIRNKEISLRNSLKKEENEREELTNEGVAPPQTPAPTRVTFSLNEENEGNGGNGDLDLGAIWQFILRGIPADMQKDRVVAMLRNAQLVGMTDHTLLVELPAQIFKTQLETPANRAIVQNLVEFATGEKLTIEYTAPEPKQETGRVKGR